MDSSISAPVSLAARAALRQVADLVGHHREAHAGLTGTRSSIIPSRNAPL